MITYKAAAILLGGLMDILVSFFHCVFCLD